MEYQGILKCNVGSIFYFLETLKKIGKFYDNIMGNMRKVFLSINCTELLDNWGYLLSK